MSIAAAASSTDSDSSATKYDYLLLPDNPAQLPLTPPQPAQPTPDKQPPNSSLPKPTTPTPTVAASTSLAVRLFSSSSSSSLSSGPDWSSDLLSSLNNESAVRERQQLFQHIQSQQTSGSGFNSLVNTASPSFHQSDLQLRGDQMPEDSRTTFSAQDRKEVMFDRGSDGDATASSALLAQQHQQQQRSKEALGVPIAAQRRSADSARGSYHYSYFTPWAIQAVRSLMNSRSSSADLPSLRHYQLYPGNNVFCCGGRVVMGPSLGTFCVTLILILGPFLSFAFFPAQSYHPAVLAFGCFLCFSTLVALFRAATTDPGIVPRFVVDGVPPLPQSSQLMDVDGTPRKFCETCNIYRPPRTKHCRYCNNCVLQFDHHCPWVGNCVGQRNYRHFLAFIFLVTCLSAYCTAVSLSDVIDYARFSDDASGAFYERFGDAIAAKAVSFVVFLFCFIMFWSLAGMSWYHCSLVARGETTNEQIRGTYAKPRRRPSNSHNGNVSNISDSSPQPVIAPNPFDRGSFWSNFLFVCFGPVPDSNLAFLRDEVTIDSRSGLPLLPEKLTKPIYLSAALQPQRATHTASSYLGYGSANQIASPQSRSVHENGSHAHHGHNGSSSLTATGLDTRFDVDDSGRHTADQLSAPVSDSQYTAIHVAELRDPDAAKPRRKEDLNAVTEDSV